MLAASGNSANLIDDEPALRVSRAWVIETSWKIIFTTKDTKKNKIHE